MISLVLLVLAADPCARCHEPQAAAFEASRHARAASLAVFTESHRHAKTPWCLSCHRPEPTAKADGLTCLTCHRVEGRPDAVRSTHATLAGQASHPVVVTPALETDACATCHEFTAPKPGHLWPAELSAEPLQSTLSELRGAEPTSTCSTCHDPHASPGAHDPRTLARAITISATSTSTGLALDLVVGRTGHRFPTGDPFRRLVLESCRDPACADVVARVTLQRTLGERAGLWTTLRDTTLASGEHRRVELEGGPWWRARFFYGDPRFESELPPQEVGFQLAGGRLDDAR